MRTAHGWKRIFSLFLCVCMLFSALVVDASAAVSYKDGTYTGTGTGLKAGLTLSVTISEGKITKIDTVSNNETPSYYEKATAIFDSILRAQSTNVDSVSGATKSSHGIKAAVDDALLQAVDPGLFQSGAGTASNPYVIHTADQLAAFANSVDNGTTYEGQSIILDADLDLSGISSWNPIGAEGASSSNAAKLFNGSFDGKEHTITGLKISGDYGSEANVGLFSTLGAKASVKDLSLTGVTISVTGSAALRVGALAGDVASGSSVTSHAVIDSVSTSGSVQATSEKATHVGGLVGRALSYTVISNCWTNTAVSASVDTETASIIPYAGGVAGQIGSNALLVNSLASGNVTSSAPNNKNTGAEAGGLVGFVQGRQYNCYAMGDITVTTASDNEFYGALDGYVLKTEDVLRAYSYYAPDTVITVNQGVVDTVGAGSGQGFYSYDTVFQPIAVANKDYFGYSSFENIINGNLSAVSKLIADCGYTGVTLREWERKTINGFRTTYPVGDVWVDDSVDAGIFASGSGTETDPYLICTKEQLESFADSLTGTAVYTGKYVALGEDIDLSGSDWEPIGGGRYAFNGTFDGKDHTIYGMSIGTSEENTETLSNFTRSYGLFGILGASAMVKNVNLSGVSVYADYEYTAYVGGIAGRSNGSSVDGDYTGAVIDSCTVSGSIYFEATINSSIGGIVGYQNKGAVVNCVSNVDLKCVLENDDQDTGYLLQLGGLVGMTNRGLTANSCSYGEVYGSANRDDGRENGVVASSLVGTLGGFMVNCYSEGGITVPQITNYAGTVAGWVTGLAKCYHNLYFSGAQMSVDGKPVDPPESVGTRVPGGITEEGDLYTGGLVDGNTSYDASARSTVADQLNSAFSAFPLDITQFGLAANAMKQWTYDTASGHTVFADTYANAVYVRPDCETVKEKELTLQDGTWYGRDPEKTSVVKIVVSEGAITSAETVSGASEGDGYDAALTKAKEKSCYGDTTGYDAADLSVFSGGTGTSSDPYQISTAKQLQYLSSSINEDVDWSGVYFKQTENIDLSGIQWKPIGWTVSIEENNLEKTYASYPFRGNYDGGDHTISNLTMGTKDSPVDVTAAGLFGFTLGGYADNSEPTEETRAQAVELSNIHLQDVSIHVNTQFQTFIGGLVGDGQEGIYIDNCSVTGEISAVTADSYNRVGGLSAYVLRGAVTNCWADVDVYGDTDTSMVMAGGMFGMTNRTTILNCYALGNVSANSGYANNIEIGGFTGETGGIQINCYALGDVVALKPTTDVGGMDGRLGGISVDYNCYFNTDAKQVSGSTVITDKTSVGVNANNAAMDVSYGKTAQELQSDAFAALLNTNKDAIPTLLETTIKNFIESDSMSSYGHRNYYEGNALRTWALGDQVVGLTGTQSDGPDDSKEASCTVTFDVNGGNALASNTAAAAKNGKLTEDKIPTATRNGYQFQGWYTGTGDDAVLFTAETTVSGDITVYAKWTENAAAPAAPGSSPSSGNHSSSGNSAGTGGNSSNGSSTGSNTGSSAGTTTETTQTPAGVTVTTTKDESGNPTGITADIPAAAVKEGEKVTLPVELKAAESSKEAAAISVSLPADGGKVSVELPVADLTPGTVAVLVKADGTEEIIQASALTEKGLAITLDGSATVKVIDNSKAFSDVSESYWGSDAIAFASARTIFNGTSDTTFSPAAAMTRQMLMTVLARLNGADTTGNAYEKSMAWAVENGISDGSDPKGSITREQLATMLWRYAGEPTPTQTSLNFNDANQVSTYAKQALLWANEMGIMSGKGNGVLDPKGMATRAQVAQMMMNFINTL